MWCQDCAAKHGTRTQPGSLPRAASECQDLQGQGQAGGWREFMTRAAASVGQRGAPLAVKAVTKDSFQIGEKKSRAGQAALGQVISARLSASSR